MGGNVQIERIYGSAEFCFALNKTLRSARATEDDLMELNHHINVRSALHGQVGERINGPGYAE